MREVKTQMQLAHPCTLAMDACVALPFGFVGPNETALRKDYHAAGLWQRRCCSLMICEIVPGPAFLIKHDQKFAVMHAMYNIFEYTCT